MESRKCCNVLKTAGTQLQCHFCVHISVSHFIVVIWAQMICLRLQTQGLWPYNNIIALSQLIVMVVITKLSLDDSLQADAQHLDINFREVPLRIICSLQKSMYISTYSIVGYAYGRI